MAKILPMNLIASMTGKVCQHGDTYFVTNRQTGQVHTAKMCNPANTPPTEAQLAQRAKFAKRCNNTSQWIKTNGPTEKHPKGTEIYQKAMAAYRAQHKIGSFYGFIASKITEEGMVTIGSRTSGAGNGGSSSSSGGGDMG